MKKRINRIALVAIAALLVLAGCSWFAPGETPETEPGRLRVNVGSGGGSRNIQQPILAPIENYVITITRGDVSDSRTVSVAEGTATFDELAAGVWTVSVEGLAAGGVLVARGNVDASVEPGSVTTISMTIGPLPGEGTLVLNLSWPAGLVVSPRVAATLDRRDGSPPVDLSGGFVIDTGGDPHTASYTGEFVADSYELQISLKHGGVTVWGPDVAAVSIAEGRTTTGTYTLEEADMNLVGRLTVEVDSDLQNPYDVSFDGLQAQLASDAEMTVTASLSHADGSGGTGDPPEPDSWEWYLNGVRQADVAGSSITIGGTGVAVDEGSAYRLSLITVHGPVLSSTGGSFRVVAP